jgi:hypothetical protein
MEKNPFWGLLYLISSPIIGFIKSRGFRCAVHVGRLGQINTDKILIVRPECNRSRGKPKPNCENKIEMIFKQEVLEELIACLLSFDTTQAAQNATCPAILLLLRVNSLQQ